jgi:phosphoglycolate phosphatase
MNSNLSEKLSEMGIIVFDLDGTLINSMPAHAETYSLVLEKAFSIPKPESQKDYYFTAGQPLDQQVKHTASLHGINLSSDGAKELRQGFWDILKNSKFELFPFAINVISELSKAGYKLAISSGSSPDITIAKLRHTEVYKYFLITLGSDYENDFLLKGVEHLEYIKKQLNVSNEFFTENTLMIGDGIHDMEIAQKAKLKSIGIARNKNEQELLKAGAYQLIHGLDELLIILTTNNNRAFIPISQLSLNLSRNTPH